MQRPKLYITVGVPGAGKSTYVSRLAAAHTAVVSTDAIRAELTGDENDQTVNDQVHTLAKARARALLAAGTDVVFDATNVRTASRRALMKIAAASGAEPIALRFDTPYPLACARNAARARIVPDDVLRRMQQSFDATCSIGQLQAEGWTVINIPAAQHASA